MQYPRELQYAIVRGARWEDRAVQPNPLFRVTEADAVRTLITEYPWVQLVSHTPTGLVASPTPMLLDDTPGANDGDVITLVTHLGRADARGHGLVGPNAPAPGEFRTALAIVQGSHDYISPSWYLGDDRGQVPTWNFETAHLTCEVDVLGADENLTILRRLVAHFEGDREGAVALNIDDEMNVGLSMGTTGLRLRVTGWTAKSKLSQNKTDATRRSVIEHLRTANPALAERMTSALDAPIPTGAAPTSQPPHAS